MVDKQSSSYCEERQCECKSYDIWCCKYLRHRFKTDKCDDDWKNAVDKRHKIELQERKENKSVVNWDYKKELDKRRNGK